MSKFALPLQSPKFAKVGRLVGLATVLGGTAALLLIGAPADAAALRHVFSKGI
jgi:hypothetical protein